MEWILEMAAALGLGGVLATVVNKLLSRKGEQVTQEITLRDAWVKNFNDLQKEYTELNEKYRALHDEVMKMRKDYLELTHQFGQLQHENRILKAKIDKNK